MNPSPAPDFSGAPRSAAAGARWYRRPVARGSLEFLVVCAAAVWCYAPALRAYFVQDDYVLLAMARLIRQPAALFYTDHFPGSQFFRPLGIFVWWLAAQCVDNSARGQYLVNLVLHLGVVAALFALLNRLRPGARLNLLWATAYAVSPLAIGTALWLSDRFDLLATAGSLLALRAALGYAQRARPAALAAILACLLLAFLAKEIAIVGALAVCVPIACPGRDSALRRRDRVIALLSVAGLTGAWLAYRHVMLSNPQSLWVTADSAVRVFSRGVALWTRVGVEYLAADPRQGAAAIALAAVAALAIVFAAAHVLRASAGRPVFGVVAALLVVVLAPALVQAPVVAATVADLTPSTHWLDLVGESRLYHLALAGLVALAMIATTPRTTATSAVASRRAKMPARAAAAGLVALVMAWAPASHRIAHDYARQTRAYQAPLQALDAAIGALALPATHCRIYVLGAASIWALPQSGDAMVKATTPDLARVQDCLILGERAPWANFVRAGTLDDYSPLAPLHDHGRMIPWLRVGGLEIAYLNLDAGVDATTLRDARFVEYAHGAFADVSAAVLAGARPVRFFNARPEQR